MLYFLIFYIKKMTTFSSVATSLRFRLFAEDYFRNIRHMYLLTCSKSCKITGPRGMRNCGLSIEYPKRMVERKSV